jgi:GAF domain-containing protein
VLNLATALKVSEEIPGETAPEKLIDRVLRTAIEHAGAQRGLLIVKARQELRDSLLRAIRDAARECEHARRWEDAADLYQAAIEIDSLNEGLYRGLMLCHLGRVT